MELNVIGVKLFSVLDEVFGGEYKQVLVYQVVVVYQVGGCVGIKVQFLCGEMFGIIKKFKKQKGGGVCYGDYCVLIFVGGGVMFVVKLCSFEQKVNCKLYCVVICLILVEFNCVDCLKVVEGFGIDSLKIFVMVVKFVEFQVFGCVLLVFEDVIELLFLVVCNILYVYVVDVLVLNLVSLVGFDYVVMIVDVVKKIEEWLV